MSPSHSSSRDGSVSNSLSASLEGGYRPRGTPSSCLPWPCWPSCTSTHTRTGEVVRLLKTWETDEWQCSPDKSGAFSKKGHLEGAIAYAREAGVKEELVQEAVRLANARAEAAATEAVV